MKTIIPAILLVGLLSGCTSTLSKLPPISGDTVTYERHDPFGGTTLKATKVSIKPDGSVVADEVELTTVYPQFGLHIKVTGYREGPATKVEAPK